MEEKQTVTLTVEFQVKHNPATLQHKQEILANFFRAKGVTFIKEELKITL